MVQLVLMRHGQSEWNAANRFNGWIDTRLSATGIAQAQAAGAAIAAAGIEFAASYSSALTRTIMTLNELLLAANQAYVSQVKTWRLNERHYGILQGENKDEMKAKYGPDQVQIWRRSYDVLPPAAPSYQPAVTIDGKTYPAFDRRYNQVPYGQLPLTENIRTTFDRVRPLWEGELAPQLRAGKNLLIVAHGTSIRALTKLIEGLTPQEVTQVEIANGKPIVYNLDAELNILKKETLSVPD
ncbi:2,3-diphosphoglycerate-dependent phosphoglycerate mutase [Leuconostocaceae bacterium ESL0723]|nr:2,3-diphosphoglycerate-dependent phosphoglycerate mutase [Leuconostocaceae bacterium ESL0723]